MTLTSFAGSERSSIGWRCHTRLRPTGWLVRYKLCRKNRRIEGKTPYEATLPWYAKDPALFIREPTALLVYRNERSQSSENCHF